MPPGTIELGLPDTITLQGQWQVDGTVEAYRVQLNDFSQAMFIPTNEDGGVYVTRAQAYAFFPIQFDEHVQAILGRPCFDCIRIANALRQSGQQIAPKAEAEQAAVLYWLLGCYLQHGETWREEAGKQLEELSRQRAARIATTLRELLNGDEDALVAYFSKGEGAEMGRYGDSKGWGPRRTAKHFLAQAENPS